MPGARQTNTFGEMLQKQLKEFAVMQTAPDSDIAWCQAMQEEIVNKLRAGVDNPESAVPGDPALGVAIGMQGAPGGGPMGGGIPQMMSQMGMPGPGGPGGPMPGGMPGGPGGSEIGGVSTTPGTGIPVGDELRRILGQG